MKPIVEVEGINRAQFEADIRPLRQPAIFRGIGESWPAVVAARESSDAAIHYLKRFSHLEAVNAIVGDPQINGRFFYTSDMKALNFQRGKSPLGPFLDRLLHDRDIAQPYAMAVQSIAADELLPGFAAENSCTLVDDSVVPRLWLGNAIRVAAHYDQMENIGVVVVGSRRFTLFPPDQISNLYMGPLELTPAGTPISLVDLAAPDFDRFPRFAAALAVAQVATLSPGDAIYIPFHWWHAVDSLTAVNVFMNYWWNPAQKGMGNPYDTLLHALFAIRTLPDDQRAVWQTMFEHLVFRTGGDPVAHLPNDVKGVLGPVDAQHAALMRATLMHSLSAEA